MNEDEAHQRVRVVRRTQRTIALGARQLPALLLGAIVVVLIDGTHNQHKYEIPGGATVQLWHGLALVVLVGALANYQRAARRHRFDP